MKQLTKIAIAIFAIIATALLLSGCTSTPTGKVVQESTIKIGYLGPLTGEAASMGPPGVAAAQVAVKEINEAGGILGRNVELVIEDDACSAQSVQAINKLIFIDNVIAITGPDCGSSAGPALPIAQKQGVPVVIRWASAPGFTKIGDYIFRVYPSDAFQGKYAAEYIYNNLGKRKVAVMWVNNDYGRGLRDFFVESFKELGGEIVYDSSHEQDATDLKTELMKVKQADPDIIYAPSYRNVGKILLRQKQELDVDIPIIAGDAFDTDEIILAPEAEGVIYSTARLDNPEEFKQKIFEATGVKADKATAPLAYDSITVIADAIKRAGSLNNSAIRNALASTSMQGISSYIEFDENGDLKKADYEMRIVKDKKSVLYEP